MKRIRVLKRMGALPVYPVSSACDPLASATAVQDARGADPNIVDCHNFAIAPEREIRDFVKFGP
jgi:hypothetical protein